MQEQQLIQKILITKYEEARLRNPHYSRRAFSKRIGVSPGAMSELFNGQRRVSAKLAERICERLALDPQERSELLSIFRNKTQVTKNDEVEPNYLQLSLDHFKIIGDWYHFAILRLMFTFDFKSNISWIAQRLGLSFNVVETAVQRLKRLAIIKEEKNGSWTRSKINYRTSDDVSNISVQRAHGQYLEKAREALDTLPVNERDFTSLFFTCNHDQLPRMKELIRKFQDEFSNEIESEQKAEVYQMCIQVFPITKTRSENEK